MRSCGLWGGGLVFLVLVSGCALEEVRSKNKFGAEFRYAGSRRGDDARYHVEPGFELKWEKGVTTGFSYRRRDVDGGAGSHDDGVFFDVGFPIWKRPKAEPKTAERIQELERRLTDLESQQKEFYTDRVGGEGHRMLEGRDQRLARVMVGTVSDARERKGD